MKIISIGREDDCTIILDDSMISRHHAILKIHPTGKMEIVDMGQNGTFVNGVKLTPNIPYPVSRKDVISFAHVRQLDWSRVPDNYKLYRYVGLGVLGIVLALAVIAAILNLREPEPPYIPENPPVEKVEAGKPKEEGSKDDKEKAETPKTKKRDIPTRFSEEKKKKEKKKEEEKKKPSEPKDADKTNEKDSIVIML